MPSDVVIEMMSSEFILWRCLHGGPLTKRTVDQPVPHPQCPWDRLKARNLSFLAKMADTYGSCAVIARDGERIVGQLRFYPKAVCSLAAPGPGMCLQQLFPAGPADDFAENRFPALRQIADKALFIHCMMTGSPQQEDNPYQRKGIGSRMARTLIDWARREGWDTIEVNAYADVPFLYQVTGQCGRAFWEKLGFHCVESCPEPAFAGKEHEGFVVKLLKDAADLGIDAGTAKTRYTMRFDLRRLNDE